MPPSITELCKFLENGNYSINTIFHSANDTETKHLFSEKGVTLSTVVCYVIKFCSDDDTSSLSNAIRRLNDSASQLNNLNFRTGRKWDSASKKFHELIHSSFLPESMKFFAVPKQKLDEDGIRDHGLLAGLVHFLLQILTSEGDRVQDSKWYEFGFLQNELMFLLTILGDVPFQFPELDEVKNLLEEFEAVANEAGGFIYTYVFVTHPSKKLQVFEAEACSLLDKFKILKQKVEECCIRFASFRRSCSTVDLKKKRTTCVDSLFNVDTLLEDLEDSMSDKVQLYGKVKDNVRKLHEEIMFARSFLEDVYKEHHQEMYSDNIKDEEVMKLDRIVFRIRDVAYEAKYIINSFQVGNLPMKYLSLRLKHNIIKKFEIIGAEISEIKKVKEIDDVRGVSKAAKELSIDDVSVPTMPTLVAEVSDDVVVGFEHETIEILDELMGGQEKLQTISICGMPGLGKTTMAKKLYNHRSIIDQFDKRVWVVISQTYQRRKVLIEVVMSLMRKVDADEILKMKEESLALEIYRSLKGRRYLIVMDDIWSLDVWDDLRRCFPDDGNKSRVMLTSRVRDTAPTDGIIRTLPFLSEDQCWELLKLKVFHRQPFPKELLDIGRRIAENCKGLPLTIVVIAGLLANTTKEKSLWEKVNKSLHSYLSSDDSSNCLKILELSYNHLPCHLKLCFLYFGMFPEDTEIPTKRLKWLWIAEGFVRKVKEKSVEQVAEEYLMDLISTSLVLIQKTRSTGGIKTCGIHDLIRELCIKLAEEQNFMKLIKEHSSAYQKHQRLCIHPKSPAKYSRPFSHQRRSFMGSLSVSAFNVSQMKLLRTLDLDADDSVNELRRIGQLVHLRYLTIDCTDWHEADTDIILKLVNLEVLCLVFPGDYPPLEIRKLGKLRHLHVRPSVRLTEMYEVNNLQTLSLLQVWDFMDEQALRCSPHLRKLKCECVYGELFPDLSFLTQLECLNVKFDLGFCGTFSEIKLPLAIKKLVLSRLRLDWKEISMIGRLPSLQILELENDAFVGQMWETGEDEFQELKLLRLHNLPVKQWIIASSEHFPKLEHLVLTSCHELRSLPIELGEIPTLQMIEVRKCFFPEVYLFALKIEEQQREEYGNEDFRVNISSRAFSKAELLNVYNKWIEAGLEEEPSISNKELRMAYKRLMGAKEERELENNEMESEEETESEAEEETKSDEEMESQD